MPDDLNEFIRRHRSTWKEAERLLDRVEAEGLEALSEKEVLTFGEHYREVSDHLVRARTELSNPETIEYLNALVGRGYAVIYRGRRHRLQSMYRFLRSGFPRLCRARATEIWIALGALVAGAVFGGVAGALDPESVQYMVEREYANIPPEIYLQRKGSLSGTEEAAAMMGAVSTNNLRVAILAFAAGITLGLGTIAILFYNGVLLASFSSIFVRAGSGFELFGLLAPHGLIEMFAIVLSGAAGLVLARALLAPGARSRALALREDGLTALLMLAGSVPVILAAMVIESTLSKFQSIGPGPKCLAGFLALAVVLSWILLGGRGPDAVKESGAP